MIIRTVLRHHGYQRTCAKHLNVLLDPEEVQGLLSRLCIRFGVPPAEIERLTVGPPTNIDEFTEAALVAEGYGFAKSDSLAGTGRATGVGQQASIRYFEKDCLLDLVFYPRSSRFYQM